MSSTAFFVISKLVGLAIRAETWLVLLLALAILALWRGRTRLAGALLGAVFAAVLALTILPVGHWAITPLEARHPFNPTLDAPPDGIIVLGGAVETRSWRVTGLVHLNDAGERMTEGAQLALRFPEARVILAGGGAVIDPEAGNRASEADTMAALMTGLGIAPERLILEEKSRNTAENALFSFDLAKPAPGQTWLLVTSASHMPRAMETFERAGWTGLIAWPVDFSGPPGVAPRLRWDLALNLYYLNRAVKEYVGILAYRFAS